MSVAVIAAQPDDSHHRGERADGAQRRSEESKIRSCRVASAAAGPRAGRQAVGEAQIQAAFDHELFVSVIL